MAAGDEEVDAAEDAERPERRHDRRHPQDRDDEAVDHAEDQAEADPERRWRPGRVERVLLEHDRDAVGDQPDRRLDREVDVAGDDHDGLADRGDRRDRGEHRDLLDVRQGQELGRRERDQRAEHDHDRDEAELALARHGGEPAAGRAAGRDRGGHGVSHRPDPARRPARARRVGAGQVAGRGDHHPLLGRVVVGDLGRDPALVEDEDAVGHREDLGEVARDEDDPEARTRPGRRSSGGPRPWRRCRCRGSARRGSARRGFDASHFASTTFCWLPPDSAPTGWSTPVIRTSKRAVYSFGDLALLRRRRRAAAGRAAAGSGASRSRRSRSRGRAPAGGDPPGGRRCRRPWPPTGSRS